MTAEVETRYALSAFPASMRDVATVYRLDVERAYVVAQQGASGVTCLVQRTGRCYDSAGAETCVKVLMEAAALRIRGMSPARDAGA